MEARLKPRRYLTMDMPLGFAVTWKPLKEMWRRVSPSSQFDASRCSPCGSGRRNEGSAYAIENRTRCRAQGVRRGPRRRHPCRIRQREKRIDQFIDLAGKLLKDTPGRYPRSARRTASRQQMGGVPVPADRRGGPARLEDPAAQRRLRSGLPRLARNHGQREKYQCNVPWIILFDPTSACNKHCVGCWAADYENAEPVL